MTWPSAFATNNVVQPCSGAPTITSVTANDDGLNTCGTGGWQVSVDVVLSKPLGSQWELKYYSDNGNGATCGTLTFWKRSTNLSEANNDSSIGSDGGFGTQQRFYCFKVEVVPVGLDVVCATSTSSTITRTADKCAA